MPFSTEKSLEDHIHHHKSQREAIRNSHDLGFLGRGAVSELSILTDVFLVSIFTQAERKWQKEGKGTLRSVALVPIGGYGRSELALHSDIDLMILCSSGTDPVVEFISEHVFYALWDSGLEIGHSVRTIEDCVDMAQENFYTQTAFLDARCLAGNRGLFKDFQKRFNEGVIEGHRRVFLESILEESRQRHHRHGDAAFLLEPNIKEGKGGLRDYHSILWAAKALFNLNTIEEIENAAILSKTELHSLDETVDFLWKIRNQLHILSARKNDQLYLEYQEDIARTLGFRTRDDFLPVEEFMRVFYSHVSRMEHVYYLFFERVLHSLQIQPEVNRGHISDHLLEKDISIYKGELRVERGEIFLKKPHFLIKVFEYAAKHGVQLHPQTYQLVAENLNLVDDGFRASKKVTQTMLNLLKLGSEAFTQLEIMLKVGLLTLYLPEFGAIRCQVQFDAYHIYTVDKHSLLTFLELSRLREEDKYPFAEIEEPEYLFLVSLLHDVGKGLGHKHSETGAESVTTIARRMGLPEEATSDMAFVVRNHLLLSDIAMRRDLEDEKVIIQCAQKIQKKRRLDMLYLLTIADSKATGPRAWTDWKAALMDELYLKVRRVLEKGELATPDATARIEKILAGLRDKLDKSSRTQDIAQLENLPENYLLTVAPQKILKHMTLANDLSDKRFTFSVEVRQNFWELTILAQDRPGLFCSISGVLTLNDLDILGAQIFTWRNGIAVEVFQLKELIEGDLDQAKLKKLEEDFEKTLTGRLSLEYRLAAKPGLLTMKPKGRQTPSKVIIDNEGSDFYTVVEVYTNDRLGLLYTLAKTLFDSGLDVKSAKISTKVDQIVDVFYVQDFYGQKVFHPEQCEEIKKALLFKVEGNKGLDKQSRTSYIVKY